MADDAPLLSANEARKPGLYWIRLFCEETWTIGEWVLESHRTGAPTWYLIGTEIPHDPDAIAGVDERPLMREENTDDQ